MDSTLERATDIDSNLMWYSKQVLSSKAERTTKSQVMVMDTDNGYSTVHEQPGNAGAHDHYGKLQSVEVSKQVDTALQGLDADVRASYMRLVDCLNEVEPAVVEQTRANANDQTEQTRVEVVSSVDQPLGDAIFVDGSDDYGTGELLTQLTARQPQATYRTWPQQNLGDQNMQVDDCAPYSIANGQTMTMPEGSSLPGLEDNSLSKLAACLDSYEIDDLVNKLFENFEPTCSQAASQNAAQYADMTCVPNGQIKAPEQHHAVVLLASQLFNDSAILSDTHEADWAPSTSTSETVSPSLHVADTNIYEPVIADVQSDVQLVPPVLPLSFIVVISNNRGETGNATTSSVWPAASSYAADSTCRMQDETSLKNYKKPPKARKQSFKQAQTRPVFRSVSSSNATTIGQTAAALLNCHQGDYVTRAAGNNTPLQSNAALVDNPSCSSYQSSLQSSMSSNETRPKSARRKPVRKGPSYLTEVHSVFKNLPIEIKGTGRADEPASFIRMCDRFNGDVQCSAKFKASVRIKMNRTRNPTSPTPEYEPTSQEDEDKDYKRFIKHEQRAHRVYPPCPRCSATFFGSMAYKKHAC